MITPLRKERQLRGLTQLAVAKAVGMDQSQYCKVEKGTCATGLEFANRLEKFFGKAITRDQILYPEDYIETGARKPVQPAQLAEA